MSVGAIPERSAVLACPDHVHQPAPNFDFGPSVHGTLTDGTATLDGLNSEIGMNNGTIFAGQGRLAVDGDRVSINPPSSPVPEPFPMLLPRCGLIGLAGIAGYRRRRSGE
jgi:hypothetical protein